MKILKKILFVILICIPIVACLFYMTCTFIYNHYGVLLQAVLNDNFLNCFKGHRSTYIKEVMLPLGAGAIVYIALVLFLKKKLANVKCRKLLAVASFVVLAVTSVKCVLKGVEVIGASDYIDYTKRHETGWFVDIPNITHAFGALDGNTYTNSLEALTENYSNGIRLFECDLMFTADGELVACHDYDHRSISKYSEFSEENPPTLEEFLNIKVYGLYTTMTYEDVLLFMAEHEDMLLVTDTKYSQGENYLKIINAIYETANELDCIQALDRVIVQIYNQEMLENVKSIYDFDNYIFTLYQLSYGGDEEEFEEYARFCYENGVDVITFFEYLYTDELKEIAEKYGLQVYVHTVNGEKVETFNSIGVGVYTDGL